MTKIAQKILEMLVSNPSLTGKAIAVKLGVTQPTVSMWIRKLQKKGLLQKIYGINFIKNEYNISRIDIQTKKTDILIHAIKDLPNILNIFKISGEYNISIYLFFESFKEIYIFINDHIKKYIIKYKIEVILDIIDNKVLPVIFNNGEK